jgi:hypothetical protein
MANEGKRMPSGDGAGVTPPKTVWHKSSRSGGGNSNCVEVAPLSGGQFVGIRDSKAPSGPVLMFEVSCFHSFIAATKSGAFDLPAS